MEVRVLHVSEGRWIVQSPGGDQRWRFDPSSAYKPLGYAASRSYVSPGDLIDVNWADLREDQP